MSTVPVFNEYARYYDLLYKDKDYEAEAEYVHWLIQRHRAGATTILELGSGTGKHAVLLADRGYRVHGVERSEEMLARATRLVDQRGRDNDRWLAPTFSPGDIRTARVGQRYDAVISLFHVMSYQTTNEDLQAAFATARVHLVDGGIFVFDVWYGPAVLTDQPAVRVKRMADEHTEVTRLVEPTMCPNQNMVQVKYLVFVRDCKTREVVETTETHYMRYLFYPEVAMLAEATGFRIRHAEEWATGRPVGDDTWGACFVLDAA